MAAKRTELAPLVVERVATRVADEQRHRANRLGILAMTALLGALPTFLMGAPIAFITFMPLLGGGLYAMARSHRRREADAYAVLAAVRERPELLWSQIQNCIEGHEPDGGRLSGPAVALEGAPRKHERLALPPARIHK